MDQRKENAMGDDCTKKDYKKKNNPPETHRKKVM